MYTLSTVTRIFITLVISIVWGVSFGILAATNRVASLVLTPIIDLLQSVPILGYFPLVIGFLFALGPLGIELSVIVLLFTSMAWAIFFGVLGAVRAMPTNIVEASRSFGLTGWKYVRHVLLPGIMPAVISGANLAWSDGWFFMIAAEYIQYKGDVVAPPSGGLGLLLARAAYYYEDMGLSVVLLIFITCLVIIVNSLTFHKLMEHVAVGTFRPIVNISFGGLERLSGSGLSRRLGILGRRRPRYRFLVYHRLRRYSRAEKIIATAFGLSLIVFIVFTQSHHFPSLADIRDGLSQPPGERLVQLPVLTLLTMGRLATAYGISLVVAIVLGVMAAENKKMAAIIYPIYDVGQGVPILALFPVIYLGLSGFFGSQRIALEVTCIIMLVFDMIWYMFINITSAIKNIPAEIVEVGKLLGFKGLKRVTHIVIPAILPAIVTGSILSWGTGWNTIIFSEYLPASDPAVPAVSVPGIGSLLDEAGYAYGNTIVLVILLGVISLIVLLMEGFVWRRLLRKFEKYRVEV